MNKILTIATREFTHNLRRPSFLFGVFGFPAIIALMALFVTALAGRHVSLDTYGRVGYVDLSAGQVLSREIMPEKYPELFSRYGSTALAENAARTGLIPAYFAVSAAYLRDGRITLYTISPAPDELPAAINAFLRANLAADVKNALALSMLTDRPRLDVTVLDGNTTFNADGILFVFLLPMMFGFLLILSSVTTSTFLMSGLVEEKSNRIMEVLVTSVTPLQLLTGKLLGMGVLGLLQVGAFFVAGALGLAAAQRTDLLAGLSIPPVMALLSVVYYLLSYLLLASVGIAIGAIAGSEKHAQQLSGIFVMPLMIPYPLMVLFILNPNGSLPVLLSLIPFTAPLSILMRAGLTAVPLWQIAFSVAGLLILIVLVLKMAAHLFRWGIFNTHKTPGLRRIIQILRERGVNPSPPLVSLPEVA